MDNKPYVAVLVVLTASMVFLLCEAVCAAPSTNLSAMLETRLPALPTGKASLHGRVLELLRLGREARADLQVCFSIEYMDRSEQHNFNPGLEGTLREQLDRICAQSGYIWQANGDWVNFIPKNRDIDPNYILNQKIAGNVVVSKDSGKHTSIKDWFVARRASSARDVHTLKIEGLRPKLEKVPESMTLTDPTLREYVNANESLYGNDTWTVQIREFPPKEGEVGPRISLLWWGQNRRELVPVEQPPK